MWKYSRKSRVVYIFDFLLFQIIFVLCIKKQSLRLGISKLQTFNSKCDGIFKYILEVYLWKTSMEYSIIYYILLLEM